MRHPSIIDIELTNVCNRQCAFCLRNTMTRPIGMMDMALYTRIIDQIADITFPRWGKVVLAGFGEPALYPQVEEAIAYAASKYIPLRVYTNASLLTESACRKLLHPGIKSLKISLNAHGADMLTELMGDSASWHDTVQGIKHLLHERIAQSTGPEITIQLLYTASLSAQIKATEIQVLDSPQAALEAIRFWQDVAKQVACSAGISSSTAPINESRIQAGQAFPLLDNVYVKLCPYFPYLTHFDAKRVIRSDLDFSRCSRHFNNMVIFWDGSVSPCCTDVNCTMNLGNVTSASLLDVFNSPTANQNRSDWTAGIAPSEVCRICLDGNVLQ